MFGAISVPSLTKSIYCISFIDYFFRNTGIHFFRKKYKLFDKFKEFEAFVFNQAKKIIELLRNDT